EEQERPGPLLSAADIQAASFGAPVAPTAPEIPGLSPVGPPAPDLQAPTAPTALTSPASLALDLSALPGLSQSQMALSIGPPALTATQAQNQNTLAALVGPTTSVTPSSVAQQAALSSIPGYSALAATIGPTA